MNPIWNEVFEVKILMGLWLLVHTSNIGYFISDCFVSDCLCEGLCGQLTWSEMIKIGVFNEDKVSDDESLGTYSMSSSKHEIVESNSYLQFLHVCDCFDVDKLCFISLVLRLTLVQLSNKAMLDW